MSGKKASNSHNHFILTKREHLHKTSFGNPRNQAGFFLRWCFSCSVVFHHCNPLIRNVFLASQRNTQRIKNEFFKLTPISYKPKKHTENSKTNSKTYTYFLQAKETQGECKNDFFQGTLISCKQEKHTDNWIMNSFNIFLYFT